jgi:hypothetical protein
VLGWGSWWALDREEVGMGRESFEGLSRGMSGRCIDL